MAKILLRNFNKMFLKYAMENIAGVQPAARLTASLLMTTETRIPPSFFCSAFVPE